MEKELDLLERDNERLRKEITSLQDQMARQLSNKDIEISNLYEQLDRNASQDELQSMLRKENDAFRQENRLLRDKVGQMNFELDSASKAARDDAEKQIINLESELGRTRQ